jgi:DNA excision repair protein ERCC-2
MAVSSAKKFLKTIAQPFKAKDQEGISTWDLNDLNRYKEKEEEEKIRELQAATVENGHENGSTANQGGDVAMRDEFDMDDDELEAGMMELDGP